MTSSPSASVLLPEVENIVNEYAYECLGQEDRSSQRSLSNFRFLYSHFNTPTSVRFNSTSCGDNWAHQPHHISMIWMSRTRQIEWQFNGLNWANDPRIRLPEETIETPEYLTEANATLIALLEIIDTLKLPISQLKELPIGTDSHDLHWEENHLTFTANATTNSGWIRSNDPLGGTRLSNTYKENQRYLNHYIIENHRTIQPYTWFICNNKTIRQFADEDETWQSPWAANSSFCRKQYRGWTREACAKYRLRL